MHCAVCTVQFMNLIYNSNRNKNLFNYTLLKNNSIKNRMAFLICFLFVYMKNTVSNTDDDDA